MEDYFVENEEHLNIYSYQFNALFNKIKNIIGSSPMLKNCVII